MVKAVRVMEPGVVVMVENERAALGDGEVRLRVEAVGVCGSDVALFAGKHPYAVYPVAPGHELGAVVLEAAPGVHLRPGEMVTVRPLLTCGLCRACRQGRLNHCAEVRVLGVHLDGGMAEEIVLPASLAFALPSGTSAEAAAMIEPTAVAVHACHRAAIGRGSPVAILGTGIIGLLALQVAKAWGASAILAVDRVPKRLGLALELGASVAFDNRGGSAVGAGQDLCPDGFDAVLDMVGAESTLADALDLARRGGTVVLVALPHGKAGFDFEPVYRKELTLCGTRLYADDFAEAVSLVTSGRVAVDPLITHRLPLHEVERALTLPGQQPGEAIKVMLTP